MTTQHLSPKAWRRYLHGRGANIRREDIPDFEAAIDAFEGLLTQPDNATSCALDSLRRVLTHHSSAVAGNATALGRALTSRDGRIFDLLDDLSCDRKANNRQQSIRCLHRRSFRERSIGIIDTLARDRRSAASRYLSYKLALQILGREIETKLEQWLKEEKEDSNRKFLRELEHLTSEGFRYERVRFRCFESFNRNGTHVQIMLPSTERSDLTTERLSAIAHACIKPNNLGHFQFEVEVLEQLLELEL